jgi:hypothetical protein
MSFIFLESENFRLKKAVEKQVKRIEDLENEMESSKFKIEGKNNYFYHS